MTAYAYFSSFSYPPHGRPSEASVAVQSETSGQIVPIYVTRRDTECSNPDHRRALLAVMLEHLTGIPPHPQIVAEIYDAPGHNFTRIEASELRELLFAATFKHAQGDIFG